MAVNAPPCGDPLLMARRARASLNRLAALVPVLRDHPYLSVIEAQLDTTIELLSKPEEP